MPVLRLFKLTNDDEVVCEVIDSADSDGHHLVIRNALKIVTGENFMSGQRFFAFRPWATFLGDKDHLSILNGNQIVCEMTPSKKCIDEFKKNLEIFQSSTEPSSLDDTRKEIERYFKDRSKEFNDLQKKYEEAERQTFYEAMDSSGKVIKGPWVYPGSDTIN